MMLKSSPCPNSVTMINSAFVSKESNNTTILGCLNFFNIAISYRMALISFSCFPFFFIVFIATNCPVCFLRPLYTSPYAPFPINEII